MAAKLIQLYYNDEQQEKIFPFAVPYKTEGLTVFFENYWIKELVLASKDEKIAVCSWKLKEKLRWYIGHRRELTQQVLETDYEVLTFTRNTKYHQMLAAANAWHPGFLKTFDKILAKIGVTRPNEVKIPIYQNHFAARTEIYKDYVQNYLVPAMDCIQNDAEINEMAMRDSKYSDLTNQSAAHLLLKIGICYYPMIPFLLERLFSVYVSNKRIAITYL
jgi:hypothetical protein